MSGAVNPIDAVQATLATIDDDSRSLCLPCRRLPRYRQRMASSLARLQLETAPSYLPFPKSHLWELAKDELARLRVRVRLGRYTPCSLDPPERVLQLIARHM